MRLKLLLALTLAAVGYWGGTGRADATVLRLAGASCVGTAATGDVAYTPTGAIFNDSSATARTVICSIPMPFLVTGGQSISVSVNFLGITSVSCALTVSADGSTVSTTSGTSTGGAALGLSLTLATASASDAATLRCSLPVKSMVKGGTQGITDFFYATP